MELNTREQKTYELIKRNSLDGKTTSQRDIYENYSYPTYDDGYRWTDTSSSNHDHCPQIWGDIERINFNQETEIVIADNFTYKIALTSEEAEQFAKKYFVGAIKKLKRHYNIVRKIRRNGQEDLLSENYYKAYLEDELNDKKAD